MNWFKIAESPASFVDVLPSGRRKVPTDPKAAYIELLRKGLAVVQSNPLLKQFVLRLGNRAGLDWFAAPDSPALLDSVNDSDYPQGFAEPYRHVKDMLQQLHYLNTHLSQSNYNDLLTKWNSRYDNPLQDRTGRVEISEPDDLRRDNLRTELVTLIQRLMPSTPVVAHGRNMHSVGPGSPAVEQSRFAKPLYVKDVMELLFDFRMTPEQERRLFEEYKKTITDSKSLLETIRYSLNEMMSDSHSVDRESGEGATWTRLEGVVSLPEYQKLRAADKQMQRVQVEHDTRGQAERLLGNQQVGIPSYLLGTDQIEDIRDQMKGKLQRALNNPAEIRSPSFVAYLKQQAQDIGEKFEDFKNDLHQRRAENGRGFGGHRVDWDDEPKEVGILNEMSAELDRITKWHHRMYPSLWK